VPDASTLFQPLYDRLKQHSKLVLAVSGGADSTALMWLAAQWAKTCGRLQTLHVLTIDHGLRDSAANDARQVCKWASALGLGCDILAWQHDEPTSRVQEKARTGRYQLMSDWCASNGFDGVITAHHGDDQAETMLMRLARGSGVDGLSGMSERSEIFGLTVFRPLMNVTCNDLRNVLKQADHDWLEDPANSDENYERVRVRGAMSTMEQVGIDRQALNLSAKRLSRARSALEMVADEFMGKGVTVFDTGHCVIERASFESQPDEIQIRVLTRLVMWAGGAQVAVRMAKVERLLERVNSAKHTLAGAQIAVRKNTLVIGREFGRINPQVQKNVTTWDRRFVFDKPRNVQPYGLFIDKDKRQRPPELPYFVACSLPVFCGGNRKLIVPHLDLGGLGDVELRHVLAG